MRKAPRTGVFPGFGKERVQVLFGDAVLQEFARNGPQVVVIGLLSHQINATIRLSVASGLLLPQPNVRKRYSDYLYKEHNYNGK